MIVSIISVAGFDSSVCIDHSSAIVCCMFMRCLQETNANATGEQCVLGSVSFVLEVPTQRHCPL